MKSSAGWNPGRLVSARHAMRLFLSEWGAGQGLGKRHWQLRTKGLGDRHELPQSMGSPVPSPKSDSHLSPLLGAATVWGPVGRGWTPNSPIARARGLAFLRPGTDHSRTGTLGAVPPGCCGKETRLCRQAPGHLPGRHTAVTTSGGESRSESWGCRAAGLRGRQTFPGPDSPVLTSPALSHGGSLNRLHPHLSI